MNSDRQAGKQMSRRTFVQRVSTGLAGAALGAGILGRIAESVTAPRTRVVIHRDEGATDGAMIVEPMVKQLLSEAVDTLTDRGGWEAVDQAYANPPVSTEQILHPQKYPHDSPVPVLLPDLSMQIGQGWVDIEQDVMGEWYTYLILAHGLQEDARVKDEVAADAAEGWQGDAYTVLYNPEQDATVMVLRTFWESPQEAKEFRDSFLPYAGNRFGKPRENQQDFTGWRADDGVHRLYLRDDYTTWIYAPDQALVVSIWTAIGNP